MNPNPQNQIPELNLFSQDPSKPKELIVAASSLDLTLDDIESRRGHVASISTMPNHNASYLLRIYWPPNPHP